MTTINYTWDFLRFNAFPTQNTLTNVVYNVEFILTGSDGNGHAAQVSSNVGLNAPDPSNFIDFNTLTTSQAITWVTGALGDSNLQNLQSIISSQIQNQISPPTVGLSAPWASTSTGVSS